MKTQIMLKKYILEILIFCIGLIVWDKSWAGCTNCQEFKIYTFHEGVSCTEPRREIDNHKNVPAYHNNGNLEGTSYQCVEYVRRFYDIVKGYRSISGGKDVCGSEWAGNANTYDDDSKAISRGVALFRNGGSTPPRIDDIIVYPAAFGGVGHVAIIKNITKDSRGRIITVTVIEQNNTNRPNREIPVNENNNRYFIQDDSIRGGVSAWLRRDKILAKIEGSDRVYWLQNGKAYHVINPTIINRMSALQRWWDRERNRERIITFPSATFNISPRGTSISEDYSYYVEGPEFIIQSDIVLDRRSDGLLIRQQGTDLVFLIENGQRRHLSLEEFNQMGLSFDDVIEVTQAIMDRIPISTPTTIPPTPSQPEISLITPGQSVSGTLSSTDRESSRRGGRYADLYTFSGTQGQRVRIRLESSAFDTYLYLISPDGRVITENDDGGGGTNSLIEIQVPAAGTYTIEVTSYGRGETGSYTIRLEGPPTTTTTPTTVPTTTPTTTPPVTTVPTTTPTTTPPTPTTITPGQPVSGTLTTLASGLNHSWNLAIDNTHVYWVENVINGALQKVPINGGSITTLASGLAEPSAIAVDNSYVYWIERGSSSLKKISKNGGTVTTLVSGLLNAQNYVVLDNNYIYWCDGKAGGGGVIKKVSKNGGPVTILVSEGIINLEPAIAVDSNYVYFTDDLNNIKRVPINGGLVTTLGSGDPTAMTLDSSYIYWVEYSAGVVKKMPKNGGPVTILASGSNSPAGIAVDNNNVYWIEFTNPGTVKKVSINGGPVSIISNEGNTIGIAVDSTNIYWTVSVFINQGKVQKMAK